MRRLGFWRVGMRPKLSELRASEGLTLLPWHGLARMPLLNSCCSGCPASWRRMWQRVTRVYFVDQWRLGLPLCAWQGQHVDEKLSGVGCLPCLKTRHTCPRWERLNASRPRDSVVCGLQKLPCCDAKFSDSSPSRSEESHPQTNSAVQLQPIRPEMLGSVGQSRVLMAPVPGFSLESARAQKLRA